jgi:hypothetical protein
MKLPLLTVATLSLAMLCGCASASRDEVATLAPFKDTFDWRRYHLTRSAPDSPDGFFRFVAVAKNGDVTLIDRSSGESISIKYGQTMDEIAVSKMAMRVTGFDFEAQAADFEWLTTKQKDPNQPSQPMPLTRHG